MTRRVVVTDPGKPAEVIDMDEGEFDDNPYFASQVWVGPHPEMIRHRYSELPEGIVGWADEDGGYKPDLEFNAKATLLLYPSPPGLVGVIVFTRMSDDRERIIDLTDEDIETIGQLFPEIFEEGSDATR